MRQLFSSELAALAAMRFSAAELAGFAIGDPAVRVGLQGSDLDLDFARIDLVVRIEVLKELPSGQQAPAFARCARATILPVDGAHEFGMPQSDFVASGSGPIGGAVVHEDELDRAIGLRKNLCRSFAQEPRSVEDWHDDRNQAGNERCRRHQVSGRRRASWAAALFSALWRMVQLLDHCIRKDCHRLNSAPREFS